MQIREAIQLAHSTLRDFGTIVKTEKWQGVEAANPMYEYNGFSFVADIPYLPEGLAVQTKANLPWAEDHFQERVSGIPSNPGEQYKNWPYYPKQDGHIRKEQFTHTYQERFWPKSAGLLGDKEMVDAKYGDTTILRGGIRYEYGDYLDVIKLLLNQPNTRQAFLPIWFSEDTGAVHGGRVPCTLGYLFQMRDDRLHITYYIRSCDYLRHFRDDIYMAGRLVQHTLKELIAMENPHNTWVWKNIVPGTITMHIANLHIFAKEQNLLKL